MIVNHGIHQSIYSPHFDHFDQSEIQIEWIGSLRVLDSRQRNEVSEMSNERIEETCNQ